MKENRSLAISSKIQECKVGNIIGMLEKEFPSSVLTSEETLIGLKTSRDRVFTINNTLLTMVLSSVQQDKTLKNSVGLYYMIHQQHQQECLKELEKKVQEEKEIDQQKSKQRGRPKNYQINLPKSLVNDISLNTAAYSKARSRVPQELVHQLFTSSCIKDAKNDYTHWKGYRVFIGDGTYLQMQDTESIREHYEVKYNGTVHEGYPQGLLETITERGTGQVINFRLSSRHTSELPLFYEMLDEMPTKSLLLLDDLYNCYEILSKCKRKGIEMIVPAKRKRNYEVLEVIGKGDEIIQIKAPKNRSEWVKENENEKDNTLLLRRIECESPDGKQYVLMTTLLEKTIEKEAIQALYLTRWDIEISIREIKTIMDINILRAKTPQMALKELTVSLATYNLIRKIIYASIKNLPFFPKEGLIQKFYTFNTNILVDKKGRVYNRWSTGRKRTGATTTETTTAKKKA